MSTQGMMKNTPAKSVFCVYDSTSCPSKSQQGGNLTAMRAVGYCCFKTHHTAMRLLILTGTSSASREQSSKPEDDSPFIFLMGMVMIVMVIFLMVLKYVWLTGNKLAS